MNDLPIVASIASEYWMKEDYDDLVSIFHNEIEIKNKDLARWEAGAGDPVLLASFAFLAGPIIKTTIDFLVSKMFEKFLLKLSNKMSTKNYPHLALKFSNDSIDLTFEVTSTDDETIQKAVNAIKDIITQEPLRNEKEYFYYDVEKKLWEKFTAKPISKTMVVTVTGTRPFEKDGKKIQISKEELKQINKRQKGMPFLLGHHGTVIGIVIDSWIESEDEYEIIKAEVGIFEDITSEQKEAIKNCKGVSLGGSY